MCAAAHPAAEPASLTPDALAGTMAGSSGRYEKHLADLAGLYRDDAAFRAALAAHSGEPVYWVESNAVADGPGALTIGISVLQPGRIGEEFAMTRGHLHERSECAELYYGLSGTGVMLLDALDGRSRAVPITPGVAVHVPGGWVHRSVNVGPDTLSTLFCYETDAGQDYGIIDRAGGMSLLVVADETAESGWSTRPNPDHRGYRG
jgi:glucose-6-phosphate isomerase